MCDIDRKADPGTVSHGTLREEDLIPAFLDALAGLGCQDADVAEIRRRVEGGDYDFTSEDAIWDLNDVLFDRLNDHAPEGHYFGAHPGDGSDFGFWENEEDDW